MRPPKELSGVLPVVQTPFLADETIDSQTLVKELNWVLDQGVSGVTTGMVSEVLRLTESERQELAETVIGVAIERDVISVVSCGAESTKTAIRYAEHAQATGADAVMVIGPLTVALGDKALYEYYDQIAKSVSIGVVVQDASGYVGRPLTLELQVRLLETHGSRIYFKPEGNPIGPNISKLRDATNGQARILEGTGGAALVDSYRRGIVGTMPGAEVCWAIQKMWSALCAGDYASAYRISDQIVSLVHLSTSIDVYVAIEKYLLKKQGIFPSVIARTPVSYEMDEETKIELDMIFSRLKTTVADIG